MSLRVYRSVKAVTGAAKALFWKISETQNFTYLTILKHQNTKTSLNKLSKNPSEENYNLQSLMITLYLGRPSDVTTQALVVGAC